MQTLTDHIKSRPEQPLQAWASQFGISRPHLHALMEGTRNPSLDVALRIEKGTGGEVPAVSWPNIAAVLRAATGAQA